jgi:deoxyribose-phosphate aldolase
MIPLHRYIEQTVLKPTLVDADIEKVVEEARLHAFWGVCVPPFWVKKAAREIGNSDIQLVTVIGFPLGYQMTEIKLAEMKMAMEGGANELDLVMNISAFKAGMNWPKIEWAKAATIAHDSDCLLKVIIETGYLSDEEISLACKWAADAGVDFVKTSTGFAPEGAKVSHIQLMRSQLPSSVGIKASGGIKTRDFAEELIQAGADRLGTSSGVEIIKGELAGPKGSY